MTAYFDECPERSCTESTKWNKYAADVLPMWVADMDFKSPPPVIEALQDRAAHGVFGYSYCDEDVRAVVVDWIERRYHWRVQPETLVFLPGVVTGFNLACHTVAGRPGTIVVQPPVYHPMLLAPGNAGMTRVDARLVQNPDGDYAIDWHTFERSFDLTSRMFLLCNPQNPTGRVFRRDELERMAEICLERGVLICSDEIHCDLLYSGQQHLPIAALDPEIARHSITLMAPSKTFNIAGLQFSFAVIPDAELRSRFTKSNRGLTNEVNLMGIAAAQAAYTRGETWLAELLIYLEANRDLVVDFVRTRLPGIRMGVPEGTYLAWLDCRELKLPESPAEFFLREAQVALVDGAVFGPGGEGFVRLNFGCPRSQLKRALLLMEAALVRAGA
jgi:cystathionine beta-lyase